MTTESCDVWRQRLVDFADGLLAGEEARQVEAHLRTCTACQEHLAGLRRSLALAVAVWEQDARDLHRQAVSPRAQASSQGSARAELVRRARIAGLAAAACIAIAVGARLLWPHAKPVQEVDGPPQSFAAMSEREVLQMVEKEQAGARLAAAARILSAQPGCEGEARRAREYIAAVYGRTSASREILQATSKKGDVQ